MTSTAVRVAACLLLAAFVATQAHAQPPDGTDLVGLWKAKRRFGPDARGPLIFERNGSGYAADMMGERVPVAERDGVLGFDLPDGGGGFRGRRLPGGSIRGVWFSTAPGQTGSATPVILAPIQANRWSGQVVPVDEELTFYLDVTRRPDGSLAALLANPERDFGAGIGVRGLVRAGNQIRLIGGRGRRDTVVASASFDSAEQVITLEFRGDRYDFHRDSDERSGFFPRGRHPDRYAYRVPPALDDGWPTVTASEVGIDRARLEEVVQRLADMPMDSIDTPQIHSLLIARHGRLVLEEYFHGNHRDKLHNERSASKSVTATLVGAAMLAGKPVRLSAPVYQVMNGGAFPADLDPRKRAMTLDHLMTMSSGLFCDDNDDAAPGNENGMWEQTAEPDFYRFTLKLPMAYAPGDTAIYCSCNPNLALGVLGRATGESPYDLFDRLVAAPLGIHRYAWAIDRARNPYGGGGMGFVARDFMKFGQLMLDGGAWHGRRIVSRAFVAGATAARYRLGSRSYGLLWWSQQYTVNHRPLRWFAALGTGGQVVMVVPELDLVIATNGGSYLSRGYRYITNELIPNLILPIVAP